MGMRGKREAGNREEAGLPQGTEKEELRVTGSPMIPDRVGDDTL